MVPYPPLPYPEPKLDLARKDGKVVVKDVVRRKYLVLTPEEWVRQHILHYMLSMGYSIGRMATEHAVKRMGRTLRADIVYYNAQGKPILLVECKAPKVPVSSKTLIQAASYNAELNVPFLCLSNGLETYLMHIQPESGQVTYLDGFPSPDGLDSEG